MLGLVLNSRALTHMLEVLELVHAAILQKVSGQEEIGSEHLCCNRNWESPNLL